MIISSLPSFYILKTGDSECTTLRGLCHIKLLGTLFMLFFVLIISWHQSFFIVILWLDFLLATSWFYVLQVLFFLSTQFPKQQPSLMLQSSMVWYFSNLQIYWTLYCICCLKMCEICPWVFSLNQEKREYEYSC